MGELELKINELERKIADIESKMSYSMSESLKDRIFLPTIGSYTTQSIYLSGGEQSISVPAQPSGTIPIEYKGTIYKLLYE